MNRCKQLAITLVLAVMSLTMAQAAVAPAGKQVSGAIKLQGGSDSAVKYVAPFTSAYKVHILVPATGTAVNALYRVYPKGKRLGSTTCVSTDIKFPCHEVTIDQTQYLGTWVQLMLGGDAATQWDFVKGKGYVTAVADNLGGAEQLNLSALARFENMTIAIGKTYQGGIIFHIDGTGEHGLVAAPTDQSAAIQWYNGSYIVTGATGTAVGTGQANTTKIITVQGAGSYAASLSDALVIGPYTDWFLPSKDELNLMYHNIGPGAPPPLTNVGGFASGYYWSSSEGGFNGAWIQRFASGDQINGSKYYTFAVRAVRAF